MNGQAGAWRRSRAAQFADPRHREQTINSMRRDASRVVSLGRESESLWESYQPTVSTATGGWSNTGRRRAEKAMPEEKKGFVAVSRQGVWTPLVAIAAVICIVVMAMTWLNVRQQISDLSEQNMKRSTEITAKQSANQELSAQISVATRQTTVKQKAEKLGFVENKLEMIELSGVENAIYGIQDNAESTMTTTDVALLLRVQ